MVRFLLALALVAAPAAADAGWRVATSRHFVVYTQENEAGARDAAERLEKFQYVLRTMSGAKAEPSPVKVSIFMVADDSALQATLPYGGLGVAGYYNAPIRGPFAVMRRRGESRNSDPRDMEVDRGLTSQQVLLHELTHHFTFQYFPAAYPTWYTEGFADYFGSLRFAGGTTVRLGDPVTNRYLAFQGNEWLPVPKLLTAKSYADVGGNVGMLYAEGWLLVHYLSNTTARPGQLKTYLTEINAGKPFDQAARTAFGDLSKLDAELHAYSSRGKLQAITLPFKTLDAGPVAVRDLTPAEDAMLPIDIQLFAGIASKDAGAVADRAKAIAARYPTDAYVLERAVEAQRLVGRTADARALVDQWTKAAPDDGLALAAKAQVEGDVLVATKSTDAKAWGAVRQMYVTAAKKAPDRPRLLRDYYRTYRRQGVMPPESAQNALYAAFELLPQDDDLRQELAGDFEQRGMIAEAITIIKPAAYQAVDPSELTPGKRAERARDKARYRIAGQDDGETAREMLTRIEKKAAGTKSAEAKPTGA